MEYQRKTQGAWEVVAKIGVSEQTTDTVNGRSHSGEDSSQHEEKEHSMDGKED